MEVVHKEEEEEDEEEDKLSEFFVLGHVYHMTLLQLNFSMRRRRRMMKTGTTPCHPGLQMSISVKKKVSYSQKRWILVKKSQGKVKNIDFLLTFVD